MKLNQKSGARIAMTAAALLVSGGPIGSAAAAEFKGRCFGVNGCAGKGDCKSTKNDCKGKNACKGQGWVEMLQDDCKNSGGQYENS